MKVHEKCWEKYAGMCVLSLIFLWMGYVSAETGEIPIDPKVRIGRLDNGLTYFVRANQRPENRAELRLVVNAGSVLEDDDQRGLAHFCEHMAFNGTAHFAKQELIDFLESIGMRFGPEINAYTGFDETVYMLEIPLDDTDVVEKAFLVLEDWAHGVSYEAEEIDKERGVIIEEWRQGRGASARMRDQQLPVIFKGSKYADRLIIGDPDIIQHCDYETLRRFYRDWYRPDLMAVVAVGDFNVDDMESRIIAHFTDIPSSGQSRERQSFPVPDHEETLFAIATDPEATQTSVSVYIKHDPLPENRESDYRRMLMESLYDEIFNQRLSELARQADPPFLYAFAGEGRIVRSKVVSLLAAGVQETGLLRGLDAVLTEAVRVRQHGFTLPELQRAKAAMLRVMESAYIEREKSRSSAYAGEYIRHFLEGEPIPGVEYEYALQQALLPDITLDEVNRLVEVRLSDQNRVILVNAPEKDDLILPTESELMTVFESVAEKTIDPYVESVSEAPLVETLPEPGKVVETATLDDVGVTRWTLSNGIRVYLKPTDFKEDEILFTSVSPGGHSLVPDSLYLSAVTATSILREGGLGPFSRIELQKKLADKIARAAPVIGSITEGVYGSASPRDVETMFQLLYLTFTAPRADSAAFDSYRNRLSGFIENRNSPETAFQDTLQVTLAQYHHRARPWTLELLDELDLTSSFEIYQDRFADAGDFTFVFVGSFDPDSIQSFIEMYIGGLPITGRNETWGNVGMTPPQGVVEKSVRKGLESKGHVQIVFPGAYQWSRENNYHMGAMVEALDIILREALREELGGTYGVAVDAIRTRRPREEYRIYIDFGCDPERVEELTNRVFAQIDSLRLQGLSDAITAKVKEAQLRTYETNLKENAYWLSAIRQLVFYARDLGDILTYNELAETLTSEDIKQAALQYFDFDRYVRVVLLPE